MCYAPRSNDPYLNRFIQPDTIVPNLANPQSWNRFSYVGNNPIKFTDPTGHMFIEGATGGGGLPDPIDSPDDDDVDDDKGGKGKCDPNTKKTCIDPDHGLCIPKLGCSGYTGPDSYYFRKNFERLTHNLPSMNTPIEIFGYTVDIAEFRGLLSNRAAFKLGFGLDAVGQWLDDSGKNYNLEAHVERSLARGAQGVVISFASTPFGLAGAGASEIVGPFPGDGVIGFGIGYIAANKTFSNRTESFMQNTVFPLFPLFTK